MNNISNLLSNTVNHLSHVGALSATLRALTPSSAAAVGSLFFASSAIFTLCMHSKRNQLQTATLWTMDQVVAGVKNLPNSLGDRFIDYFPSPEKRKDLTKVSQNDLRLQPLKEGKKSDKDVVLAAVRQNGLALEYAHSELKKDQEVVLAAVRQNALAVQWADPKLHTNSKILRAPGVAELMFESIYNCRCK